MDFKDNSFDSYALAGGELQTLQINPGMCGYVMCVHVVALAVRQYCGSHMW